MNMFWNGKVFVSSGWRSAALVHTLRAATIAALASSFVIMKTQSETDTADAVISSANAQEPSNEPPPVEQLDSGPSDQSTLSDESKLAEQSLSDQIKEHAFEVYKDKLGLVYPEQLKHVYVTISYTDQNGGNERLLSLADPLPAVEPTRSVEVEHFQIPMPKDPNGVPIEDKGSTPKDRIWFRDVVVIYTGSPDAQMSCTGGGAQEFAGHD